MGVGQVIYLLPVLIGVALVNNRVSSLTVSPAGTRRTRPL